MELSIKERSLSVMQLGLWPCLALDREAAPLSERAGSVSEPLVFAQPLARTRQDRHLGQSSI
eukprot:4427313-Pleurochrysis_carterae.AAC.2